MKDVGNYPEIIFERVTKYSQPENNTQVLVKQAKLEDVNRDRLLKQFRLSILQLFQL